MGTREEAAASKPSKPAASTQEILATPAYPDWSSPMQAYYGPGAAPPFFASTVASPTPHPYLWGGQHAMIPPYGTPIPYGGMYPPGGVYAHPSMAVAPGSAQTTKGSHNGTDGENGPLSSKKRKGASGNEGGSVGTKGAAAVKATSASGNDAASQSAESGSEGSSDANEDSQQESGTRKAVVSAPVTNLNMGMDLWNAHSGASKMRPGSSTAAMVPGAMMSDQWNQPQDERELRRQRRKQSNRESARRSRLRKQAECEELQVRVDSLSNENSSLREELQRLFEECTKLSSENSSIKEELTRVCATETDSRTECTAVQPQGE